MNPNMAWSFSRLESSETCPRKYYHLNVAKDLKEPVSSYQTEGTQTHEAFRDFFKSGSALPLHLRHHLPVLQRINGLQVREKVIEQQIALDIDWKPVDWFSKGAWVRVISDLTQLNGSTAICWDWKTGKPKDDFTQLKLNAAITMHLAPEVNAVKLAYYWTKTKAITDSEITRADLPEFWGKMLKRVEVFQNMYDKQDFPPRPNAFCRGCVVSKCQYWSPRKS